MTTATQEAAKAKRRKNSRNGTNAREETPVHVDLEGRRYDIHVERGLIKNIASRTLISLGLEDAEGRTAVVLMNPKIEHYYGRDVYSSLERAGFKIVPVILVAGETYKTLQTVRRVYKMLYEQAVDRRTVVFAVGGGVIGDVAGYVAATYQRGLDFVQVPTTLLAQVDSSVGGKVGVNFEEAKNLIGAFYQPRVVLIDPDTLESLPFRERRSGLAEIIKYGAIADEEFFHQVAKEVTGLLRLSSSYLETAIAKSCRIKARIVEQDERDMDIRAILNFGHTIGHAAEALTDYHVYRHGEAVAVGMVSACLIGEEMGVTPPSVTAALLDVLINAGFPIHLDERLNTKKPVYVNDVLRVIARDKKSVDGSARFVLLESLGKATAGHAVPNDVVRAALQRQRAL